MIRAGGMTRFILEQEDGTTFDLTGYVTSYDISNCFDGVIEANLTVIGDGVSIMLEGDAYEPLHTEPLKTSIPYARRCDYCKQLNDEAQLSCGHCGGELYDL